MKQQKEQFQVHEGFQEQKESHREKWRRGIRLKGILMCWSEFIFVDQQLIHKENYLPEVGKDEKVWEAKSKDTEV